MTVQILPVTGLPEIVPGDDLGAILAAGLTGAGRPEAGDILVVAQKIVSKAEGRIVALDAVVPSAKARDWAQSWRKDARVVELVLRESVRLVRMERGVIIAETRHGFVCANAGVDVSNAPGGHAILLPEDLDASARAIRAALMDGGAPAVIISDTFGRPWREGLVNVAIGVAGLPPLNDLRGTHDANGKVLEGSIIAFADECAAAAGLVMGKAARVPAALVRGAVFAAGEGSARELVRPAEKDLFR